MQRERTSDLKIVFMGTPDFARTALEKILDAGHEVVLVVTQPDKPKGRSGELQVSDVKACALERNIPVFQPVKIREKENVDRLREVDADIYVVAAFGQILPQEVLDIPRLGCVNIHASLLPKYRGAAPIQQAIIDGESKTGVTIMQMAAGMDTGDILLQRAIPISHEETGGSLFDKLSDLGGELITEALPLIERGELTPVPQDEALATKCGKLSKDMGHMDFSKDAVSLWNLVRGLNPWPSAYTYLSGKMLKIWKAEAISEEQCREIYGTSDTVPAGCVAGVNRDSFAVACGKGMLQILELQLEGKKRMQTEAFLLGYKIDLGTVLK